MRAALVLCGVIFALPAHATWRSSQIAGTPTDVEALDAGLAVVSSSSAMSVFGGSSAGGISAGQSAIGSFTSATWRIPNCLVGLQSGATVLFSGGCGNGANPLNGGVTVSGRLKRVSDGSIYANVSRPVAGQLRIQRAAATVGQLAADWAILTTSFSESSLPTDPFAVIRLSNGIEYGAWGITSVASPVLNVYVDGGSLRSFTTLGSIRDVALFERNGSAAALVLNDGGAVLLNEELIAGSFVASDAPLHLYSAVAFTAQGGSANGTGFGLLANGNQLFGAVPNPAAVGKQWVPRTEDAGFVGTVLRVSCFDPASCAVITNSPNTSNVYAYFNDSAPTSDLRAATVPAGGSATYVLDAGDPDGDPIWVTWIGGPVSWDGGNPKVITVTAPAQVGCAVPASPPLLAMLSDGLAAHDRQISIPVTVTAGAAAAVPLTATPMALSFTAGDSSQAVTADYPPDSGCAAPALSWSISPDGGITLTPNQNSVSVAPPAVFCRPAAQVFTLTAVDAADASVAVPVTLAPWGAPNAPVFNPSVVSQPAGTTATYPPTAAAVHACAATAGFPGADLVWILDAGSPGVTVTASGTGLTVASSDACVGGSVFATSKRRVNGFPLQLSSGSGQLRVDLAPDWQPVTAFDAGFAYDEALSALTGNFSSNANCEAERDLRARVTITASDGGAINAASGLAVPGPWSVTVPGGCSGGGFVATASLVNDAGTAYGPASTLIFEANRIAARVPALTATTVPVTCGEGARGSLGLNLLPTDCAAQDFRWTQDQGPKLLLAPDAGAVVSFATATQDLQNQAGQTLGFSITATIGPGNTAVASRQVTLVPAPFVEVVHHTDLPVAQEEEVVGVEVVLTNPTACAVSGLVLRESLGGLDFLAGSVRVGGRRVQRADEVNGTIEVPDLALPALGRIRISYLAKVPLLSKARPSAQVFLAGTDVTAAPPLKPTSGCGCDASSSSGFALMALGLVMMRSRRRSR